MSNLCDGKFAGFDDLEADLQDETLDGTTISYSVHLTRPCANCATDAAEADLEFDIEIEHDCGTEPEEDEDETDLELENSDMETTDAGGGRYAKRMLGVSITAHVHCNRCDEYFDVAGSESVAASSFEELGSH